MEDYVHRSLRYGSNEICFCSSMVIYLYWFQVTAVSNDLDLVICVLLQRPCFHQCSLFSPHKHRVMIKKLRNFINNIKFLCKSTMMIMVIWRSIYINRILHVIFVLYFILSSSTICVSLLSRRTSQSFEYLSFVELPKFIKSLGVPSDE